MRVCLIGGTGNISTSITRLLLEMGHEVAVFNRGQTPGLPAGARAIQGDRQDRAAFEARLQDERFDWVIDMICYTAEDARSTLRACKGVKHLIHCSTVCTYGVDYDWLPVSEDHPLRPISDYGRNKVAADDVFLAAYHDHGFPVTIIKPSTTVGPRWPVMRQVDGTANPAWVDRVRQGKPIVVCGDGKALHQWLHVDDAAPAFAFALGREKCVGQVYNMMKREYATWEDYHRTVMRVIGREVEQVGVPLATLLAAGVPNTEGCRTIFAHNTIYSPERLMRDVPEFHPRISLEDLIADLLATMEQRGIPSSDEQDWEDRLIAAQRQVGELGLGR
ncbi:MAG: NAD-dependent epimerase/dehydratase family protein [Armatimonadetes bacterium]|nr:NAD-dependent epimerase/dehydratase family protein [Armatimonadota bacterium]